MAIGLADEHRELAAAVRGWIEHKCARMAIAVEQARAVVWDAARAADAENADGGGADPGGFHFAAAAAGLIAPRAALDCARDCIQVHGGIGFTWEHPAHRYLRRASTLRVLIRSEADWAVTVTVTVADLALAGGRRPAGIELDDPQSRELRAHLRSQVDELATVPDDCVIGEPGQGWKVARNTLSNERVALSSGTGMGAGIPELMNFFTEDSARAADRDVRAEIGRLVAQGQAIELLGLRVTLKQLSGTEPGAESSVRKLLGVEFDQRVADFIWEHQGSAAVCEDTSAASGIWARFMLFSRSMTIYGGTTEVQLNIIGERLLGLPRDPEA